MERSVAKSYWGNFSSGRPLLLVLDGAIQRVRKLGIKIDVLLGDFDGNELDLDEIEREQYPIKIIHTPDQEKCDLEKGIEYLITQGHAAVNIVWASGRRLDHTIANAMNVLKYKDQIQIVMYDDYSRVFPLKPRPAVFEKWYKAGTPLSLIPFGRASGIDTQNLKYNLQNGWLESCLRLGSNNEAYTSGLVQISYESGQILLLECWDNPQFFPQNN